MANRGTQAPNSVVLSAIPMTLAALPTGGAKVRWYPPALPYSRGVVIKGVRMFIGTKTNTGGTLSVTVTKNTTTMLSTTFSSGANATTPYTGTATLANNGTEIINPGDYIACVVTASAGTQSAITGYRNMTVQVDFDRIA